MKKILCLLLILCMLLSFAPAVFAENDEIISDAQIFQLDEDVAEVLEEGEPWLDQYAEAVVALGSIEDLSTDTMAWGSSMLSENQRLLSEALKAEFKKVALGEEDSYIAVTLEKPITISLSDLDTKNTDTDSDILTKAYQSLDFDTVLNLLLMDMPYELYWYDKTKDAYNWCRGSVDKENQTVTISTVCVLMPVIEEYRGSEAKYPDTNDIPSNAAQKDLSYYSIDSTKITAVNTAMENAQEIIKVNAVLTDYDKLLSFANRVCALAAYNSDAVSTDNATYGDPWQIIYVFDNDDTTKVVCEGYAKAFQYLCDNGDLQNAVCYTVTGTLKSSNGSSGLHMWNLVQIGDSSYLVDLTNSDGGSGLKSDGALFLIGANKDTYTYTPIDSASDTTDSVIKSYSITVGSQTLTYMYDDASLNLDKGNDYKILTIADHSYETADADHSWGDGVVTTAATLTAEGVMTYTCKYGDATKTETIEKLTAEATATPEPTHVAYDTWEKSLTEHWHACKLDCDEKLDYGEHSYDNYQAVEGNEAEQHQAACTVCGAVKTDAHSFENVEDKYVAPTESTEGSKTVKCSVCGYEITETIKALSESHTHLWGDTWEKDENRHWKKCTAEGCYLTDISRNEGYGEHQWNDGEISKEATEKEAGEKTYTCTLCGQTKTEQIPVLSSHNWSDSYSHDSKTHWLECTDSSCTIDKNENKSGYGTHNYGAYRVITAATASTNGVMQHECMVCGYSETAVIPASGTTDSSHTHIWSSWQFTSPNYWERTCSTCGNREINVVSSTTTTDTSTSTKYTMISGANQTWLRGNNTALQFRADIPYSEFGNLVKLNGVELPSSYYTASEGSTIITLNDSCTSQLSTGVHTIAIYSKYGDSVETSFMVQNANASSTASPSNYAWATPKTGDSANMGLWISMAVISLMGMTTAAALITKKRKEH